MNKESALCFTACERGQREGGHLCQQKTLRSDPDKVGGVCSGGAGGGAGGNFRDSQRERGGREGGDSVIMRRFIKLLPINPKSAGI